MTTETFYAKDRAAWRRWLKRNHSSKEQIWLVYYKKDASKKSVDYDAAVEEALCFGWIDSLTRKLDNDSYIQLFTPRKPKSIWAKSNKERVKRLIANGSMTEAGMKAIEIAKENGSWTAYDAIDRLEMPADLKKALAKVRGAAKNFDGFSPSARKAILYWIHSAKRRETRAKRIAETARMAAMKLRATIDTE